MNENRKKSGESEKSRFHNVDKLNVKWTVKDSIFCNLFENKKYALQLYKTLHPEDTDVTESDIENVTIRNIFTDQEYNDFGMTVRGRLLVMLEAQSSWTYNIIIRVILYLAHTWNEYIEKTEQNRYGSKKLELPKPEFYVVYTGNRKIKEEWIRLSEQFFKGDNRFIEVNVKVLYGEDKADIISQYVNFTKVYSNQVKIWGRTRQAILETIRICRDKNFLKEYLDSKEKEVINIMMALFDQERAMQLYLRDLLREKEEEAVARGLEKGIKQGLEQGKEQGIEQGIEKGLEQAEKNYIYEMKREGISLEIIARISGKSIEEIKRLDLQKDKESEE